MKKRNYIIASALVAGATIGTTALTAVPMVSATSTDEQSMHLPPDLDEETRAELESMTDEERKEWLESHRPELPPHEDGERPGKPADMTDEEWEQKRAEMDEKLNAMTDEEREEWFSTHKPDHGTPPELDDETKAMLDAMTDEERKEWFESHRPERTESASNTDATE